MGGMGWESFVTILNLLPLVISSTAVIFTGMLTSRLNLNIFAGSYML